MPTDKVGEFNLAVERNGVASVGKQIFYDKPTNNKQQSVWVQIGILLKAIVYKELQFMEIKSTYNQLEGITKAAIKNDADGVIHFLAAKVPFREAMLYLEGFYPNDKESSAFIYKLAHCQCGAPATKWIQKPIKPVCANCSLKKALKQIEFSKEV